MEISNRHAFFSIGYPFGISGDISGIVPHPCGLGAIEPRRKVDHARFGWECFVMVVHIPGPTGAAVADK